MAIIDHSNIDLDEDAVFEECDVMPEAIDILCLRCGWEGHVHPGIGDPRTIFMYHARPPRSEDIHKIYAFA